VWSWWGRRLLDYAERQAKLLGSALGLNPGDEDLGQRIGIERFATGDHSQGLTVVRVTMTFSLGGQARARCVVCVLDYSHLWSVLKLEL
jgi:hypothetical protein